MSERCSVEPPRKLLSVFAWIAAHPRVTFALGIAAILLMLVQLFNWAAVNRLQRRIDAIRSKGEPITVKDLAARAPNIPDDENMTLALLPHLESLESRPLDAEQQRLLPYVGSGRRAPLGRHWPKEQLDAVQGYLDRFSAEIAGIHEALQLERGYLPVKWQEPMINTQFPNLLQFGLVARALALEATVAAERGDRERAAEILSDMFRSDRALAHGWSVLSILLRIGCNADARDQVARTVNLCGLDDRTLQALQKKLVEWERGFNVKEGLIGERVYLLDSLEWLRTKGTGAERKAGWPVMGGLRWWRYAPVIPSLDVCEALDVMTDLVDAVQEPDVATIRRWNAAQARASAIPWYCPLSRCSVPSLAAQASMWVQAVASARTLQAALGCERHRLATGQWPDSLQALVPEYMVAVPVDPFALKPIRYRRDDDRIIVWSIGSNLLDDEGTVHGARGGLDFGWAFLNPELRGRPADEGED